MESSDDNSYDTFRDLYLDNLQKMVPMSPVRAPLVVRPFLSLAASATLGAMANLFVYGTLMQGMRNHQYLEKAKLLGRFQTKPEFELLYNGSIPAAKAGGEAIWGELYEADEDTLASLDVLEEVSVKLYEKTQTEVDGKPATMYLGGNIFSFDTWEHVPNGDYKALAEAQKKTA